MPTVVSSNLAAVDYEPSSSELVVTFKSGRTYAYRPVPESVFNALLKASSKGRYFSAFIKDRYPTRRIK